MDAFIDGLFAVKDTCVDGLIVLPHVLMGFFLAIGLLTTNIGMISLALGQMFVVPSLSFAANATTDFREDSLSGIFNSIVPVTILYMIGATVLETKYGFSTITCLIGLALVYLFKFMLDFYTFRGTAAAALFDVVNPVVWFSGRPIQANPDGQADICFITPEESRDKLSMRRQTPSGWMIHVLFFFGFLLQNAYTIYTSPVPTIKTTGDASIDASRVEALNERVSNRKFTTGMVMAVSCIALLALILVRMNMTPCENSFGDTFVPMVICFIYGAAWYTILTDKCGISSTDILGIVQGFISPEAIDNPIVCIGSDPGPLPGAT